MFINIKKIFMKTTFRAELIIERTTDSAVLISGRASEPDAAPCENPYKSVVINNVWKIVTNINVARNTRGRRGSKRKKTDK